MATMPRHRVGKLIRSPGHADALHWPVNVLLIVFGGFVLGVALAYQRFDEPIWYRSAWTAVVGIPVFVATGIIAARLLSARWMRRSMQLGMLVSLVVHLLLVLATLHVVLPRKPWERRTPRDVVPSQTAPLLAETLHIELAPGDSYRQNLLPPIEAPPPIPDDRPQERIPADQSPVEPQPQPVKEPQPTPRPDIVRRTANTEPEVRRSATASRLSANRQWQQPLSRQVADPVLVDPSPEPQPAHQPAAMSVERSENARDIPAMPLRQDSQSVAGAYRSDVPRLARTTDDSPEPQSPVTLRRQPATTRDEPSLATHVERQSAQWSTKPPVFAPAATDINRQSDQFASSGRPELNSEAGSEVASRIELRRNDVSENPLVSQAWVPRPERRPLIVERPRSDLPDAAYEVVSPADSAPMMSAAAGQPAAAATSQLVSRRAHAAQPSVPSRSEADVDVAKAARPSIARVAVADDAPQTAARHSLARTSRSVTVQDQAELDRALAAASASPVDAAAAIRPTDTTLARQADRGDQLPAQQPAEQSQLSPTAQLANRVFLRSLVAEEATVVPFERPLQTPARGPIAASPQTPFNIDSPALRPGADTVPTPSQPAPLALSKGTTGILGAGYSMNLDRAAPAADSPALAASGASLPKAVQREDPGPALRPAVAAVVPRAQSAGVRPQSAMAVEPTVTPEATATVAVAGPAQSAAAARVTVTAQTDRGQITADQGHLEIDLGPQRTVAQLQSGRGSGGGRDELTPSLSHVTPPTRSATAQMTIRSDTAASIVSAPPGQGGSRPPAIDAAPTAVTAARTDAGGNAAITHHPSEAPAEGPPSQPSAADVLGQLSLRFAPSASEARRSPGDVDARQTAAARAVPTPSRDAGRNVPSTLDIRVAFDAPANDRAVAEDSAVATTPPYTEMSSIHGASAPVPVLQTPVTNRDNGRVHSPLVRERPSPTSHDTTVESAPVDFAPPPRVRSLSADATAGPTLAGGGNQSPLRPARSRQVAPDTRGDPSVEQVVWNATVEQSEPVSPATSGTAIQRQSGGLSVVADPMDSAHDQMDASLTAGAVTLRAARSAPSDPPAVHRTRGGVGNQRNASVTPKTTAVPSEAMLPAAAGGPNAPSIPAHMVAALAQVARPSRDVVPVALPVEADLSPGDGGLGAVVARDAGVADRRARPDAASIQTQVARIPRREPGGLPATNAAPVVAAEAFRRRVERNQPGGGDRLGPETERAIELGLAYLARHQLEDGRWSLHGLDSTAPAMNSDVAATGLALLAFQGAGYTHREYQYRDVVRRGLDFLLASQQSDGLIYFESDSESNRVTRLYSHAIAALALSEAYGMTQDPVLRDPCQKALDYIVASQSPELGGWRYTPQVSSDTSVSGWMLMALKSSELAGLTVPQETYQLVVRWLDRAQGDQPHLYRYNPHAPDTPAQRYGRVPSPTMTSVGLLMRLYTGWRRDHPAMQAGGDYLRQNLPGMSDLADPVASRRRDTYYWYYATQVMFHLGGDYWRTWNGKLHPLLVRSQIPAGPDAGSWDPFRPVPDRWAAHGGRLYVTTMNLLSLEIPYRHLPLYESSAR